MCSCPVRLRDCLVIKPEERNNHYLRFIAHKYLPKEEASITTTVIWVQSDVQLRAGWPKLVRG